jgi:hypothetical protein
MKCKLLLFILFLIAIPSWAEREIDISIISNSLYITGTDNYLELNMEIISLDDEWLTYLYFMFPAGITPNPVQTPIEGNYYIEHSGYIILHVFV